MLRCSKYTAFGQEVQILDLFAEGEIGANATVSCHFAPENGTVVWKFNDEDLKIDSRIKISNETKGLSVDVDGNKKQFKIHNITINNVTSLETGNYTCVVQWHNETRERTTFLDLSFPGKLISATKGPLRKNITENAELECVFEIYKPNTVNWWKTEKDSLLLDAKVINLKQIKSSHKVYIKSTADNGIYNCEVFDSVTDQNITGSIEIQVLDKPTLVIDTVKAIGANKLFLNWTVHTNNLPAPTYTLKYKTVNNSNYRFSPKTINSNYTSFILEDLEKLTEYNIVMEVSNSYGSNKYMYPNTVKTLKEDPDFVPNVTIKGFSATSVTIGWAPPSDEIAEHIHYYELVAQKQNESDVKDAYHPQDSQNLPYMFDDLEPYTTYIFKVRACSEYTVKVCGNWSEPNIAMTLDGIPGKPSNVTLQCFETDTLWRHLNLSWGPPLKPNGEIKGYAMELTGVASFIDQRGNQETETFGPLSKFATNTSKSQRIAELKPNTNYTIKLSAMTRTRRRGEDETKSCYTSPGPPDHPPKPTWKKINDNDKYFFKMTLPRVSERNGPICCYRVYMVRLFPDQELNDLPSPEDIVLIRYADAHSMKPSSGAYVTDIFTNENFPANSELIMGDGRSINNATCKRCYEEPIREYFVPTMPTTTSTSSSTTTTKPTSVEDVTTTETSKEKRSVNERNSYFKELDSEWKLSIMKDPPMSEVFEPISVHDGLLDSDSNYTMFVELIPGNDKESTLFSTYQNVLMPAPTPAVAQPVNVLEITLQVTCGVLAIILLILVLVCILHTRRARKMPHNNVEMNSIQATLSSIYQSLKGGRHHLISSSPPDMPAIAKEDLLAAYTERQADCDYGFQREFEMLPDSFPDRSTHASEARENQPKNRYPDIKAYDQTRVKLSQMDSILGSDYINANYVMGYKERKKFICAQGPTDATVNDFWRMVWEHGLELIVMLTNLEEYSKVKCSRYWPDEVKGNRAFGPITVTHVSEKRYSDYIVRELKITKQAVNSEGQPIIDNNGIVKRNGDIKEASPSISAPTSPRDSKEGTASTNSNERIVKQYHFLMWKDFAAPEHPYSILKFIKRVNEAWSNLMGRPVVVHCSAGVGRTGTLVALDCLLEQLRCEGQVAVFNTVAELRRQRNFLVQSLKQYEFVYRALVEYAHYGDTEIQASKLKTTVDKLRMYEPEEAAQCLMEIEFEKILNPPIPEVVKSCAAGQDVSGKNRSDDILPYDRNRVILSPMPGRDFSTYINASFIEEYDNSEGYIITQDPKHNTIPDFWRMVSEHSVSAIVMLSEIGEHYERCPRYWEDGTACYDHISVQYDHSESCPYYTKREFRLTNNKSADVSVVHQLQYHGWPTVSGQVPEVTRGLAELADAASRRPLLVHCQFGAERSSMFIALCILIIQLRTERRVDVCSVTRKIRAQRQHALESFFQYEFLHRAILNYAELHNLLEDS